MTNSKNMPIASKIAEARKESDNTASAAAAMEFFQQKILVVYHLRLAGFKPKEIYAEMTENGITTTLSSVRAFIKTIRARYEQENG